MAPSSSEQQLEEAVREVCAAIGDFIEYWGFKAIHGRIWTLLALRSQPVSQVEVADFLGVSRSLISGAMADLVAYGLVRPLSEHRNAPYEAVVDFWPTVSKVLREREWVLVVRAREALEAAVREARASGSGQWDLSRMRLLLGVTELAQGLLRVIMGVRVASRLEGLGEGLADWLRRSRKLVGQLRKGD